MYKKQVINKRNAYVQDVLSNIEFSMNDLSLCTQIWI